MNKFYLILIYSFFLFTQKIASSQTHFSPTGDFTQAMNFYVLAAKLNSINLASGDEIAIFDNNLCVGAAIISEELDEFNDNKFLSLNAGADDNETSEVDGYVPGNNILFKIWDASENTEILSIVVTYYDPATNQESGTIPTFNVGATAMVTLDATYNIRPIANAGGDIEIIENTQVQLDGSASSDPNGDQLNYLWTAPAGITLNNNTIANPVFTAPEVTTDTPYTFTLVVSDGTLNSNPDEVIITVKQVNKKPVANAGADIEVVWGTVVSLDGRSSSDPDNDPLTYFWTAPEGIVLNNNNLAQANFTAPNVTENTTFTFTLTVNDGEYDSSDDVSVNVLANKPPVALVSTTYLEIYEGQNAQIDGSQSYDPDGDPITYEWVIPGVITPNNNITSNYLDFTASEVKTNSAYTIYFRVFDGEIYSEYQNVTLNILNINKSPVADAGEDLNAKANDMIMLDGTASYDPDDNPLTYQWTAPTGISLSDYTIAQPEFRVPDLLTETKLDFILIVNDGTLSSDPDTVVITVNPIPHAPVAKAGENIRINENTTITLNGSSSFDLDGDALSYFWVSKENLEIISPDYVNPEVKIPLVDTESTYTFTLTVNDGALSSEPDTVIVSVKDNIHPPVINAGMDFETSEGSKARLEGSAISDVPEIQLDINWISLDNITIRNSDQLVCSFTAPLVNEKTDFKFVLNVNDNIHNAVTDTIIVTITKDNEAPVAEDMNIELYEDQLGSFVLQASDDHDAIFDLQYEVIESPQNAKDFSLNQSRINYIPQDNYFGKDSLKYKTCDKLGLWSKPAVIRINVLPVNDVPQSTYTDVDANNTTSVEIDFKNFISDVETSSSDLSVCFWLFNTQNTPIGIIGGLITIQGNNVFTYTNPSPIINFDYIIYKISDGEAYSDAEVVKISKLPTSDNKSAFASDNLIALNDTFNVEYGDTLNIDFLGVYKEYPFKPLSCQISTAPTNGELENFAYKNYNGNILTSYTGKYIPSENLTKSDKIKFTFSDDSGNQNDGEIVINITAKQVAPILANLQPLTVRMNQTGQIEIPYIDPDSNIDLLEWNIAGIDTDKLNANIIIEEGKAILTIVPSINYEGTSIITLSVTDDTGLSDEIQFEYTVLNDFVPFFTSTPEMLIQEDETYNYSITAIDEDKEDSVYISATNLPAWLSFSNKEDGTAEISGSLPEDKTNLVEDFIIEIMATDSIIYTPVSQKYLLHVNYEPKFTSSPVDTIAMGYEYSYTVTIDDQNEDDAIQIFSDNLPQWLTLTDHGNRTATIRGTLERNEEYKGEIHTYTLKAQDNNGSAIIEQAVTATSNYRTSAPIIINNDFILDIYPNPTNNLINIHLNQMPAKGTFIQVRNHLGQLILTKQFETQTAHLNLSEKPAGIYYIKILSNTISITRKLIKQ